MQIYDISFLFIFLPLFFVCYYLLPESKRNGCLLAFSLLFYYLTNTASPWRLAVLVVLTLFIFLCSTVMERWKHRGVTLAFSLVVLTAVLVFFKLYAGGKLLPAGMSFYLFQMAAYVIDVYRRKILAEQSLVRFGAQITMFPKILSGPLMEPLELRKQTWARGYLATEFHSGLQYLILGLAMKVLLADRIGGLWAQVAVVGYDGISTGFAWLAILSFGLRLYLDFFGYSLMAMGMGRMMGFHLPRNFDNPYWSKSVAEFWRRWHQTLGLWFRNYIYIPLGGSRKGTLRTLLNLAVVWLFTGLWHGIGPGYLLWAGILLVLIILEKLWLGKYLSKTRVLGRVYTVFFILVSWVPFAVSRPADIATYLSKMFCLAGPSINPLDFLPWLKMFLPVLVPAIVCATPLPEKIWHKLKNTLWGDILVFILFWLAVNGIATSSQDPFLYFQY
jgi:alginate O-acetyltransferase complex protein AlgI